MEKQIPTQQKRKLWTQHKGRPATVDDDDGFLFSAVLYSSALLCLSIESAGLFKLDWC